MIEHIIGFVTKKESGPKQTETRSQPLYEFTLFYLLVSGFYLSVAASWSWLHKATVLAHPAAGMLCALFLLRVGTKSNAYSAAFLSAFFTGVWIIFCNHVPTSSFFRFHGMLGCAACAVFIFSPTRKNWSVHRGFHAAAAFTLLAYVFLYGLEKSAPQVSYKAALSTVPYQKREGKKFPSYDAKKASLLNISASCGGDARCHENIVRDYKFSAHNASYQTPYFQKNLRLLEKEEGKRNTLICAGCHTPLALFSNRVDFSYFKSRDNSSCVFCHSISRVNIVDKRTSSYALSLHKNHLSMFTADEQTGLKKALNFYFIKLNPSAHKKVFSKPLYKKDEYCQVCHHLNIVPPDNQGFVRATCVDCHMQKQNVHGLTGNKKNHYFPGTNTALPYVLGETKYLQLMQRWIRGDVGMDLKTGNLAWQLRTTGGQVMTRKRVWQKFRRQRHIMQTKSFWLVMTMEALKKPKTGQKLPLRIFTSNVGMEHDFPSAPLDLIDVWLEMKVADERGRVIFHSGALDKNFHVDKNAHRLGGIMLDKDGKQITKNRVWAIDKKIVKRSIKPGQTIFDDYKIFVPKNARALYITARWNYRKLNQDFIRWAFPGKNISMPVTEVGSLQAEIKLKDD